MKDIKFRAWIKYDEEEPGLMKILEPAKVRLDYENGYALVFGIDHEDFVFEAFKSDFPVMQYTGLKDKNGVEIYEGDIVMDNIFGLRTVFYSYGGYKLVGHPEVSDQLTLMDSHTNWYEVIGNIYENPELIERKEQ